MRKSSAAIRLPEPKEDYFTFEGGLDLVTPSIRTRPGTLRDVQNIEIDINGGYTTPLGYEAFDGQTAPSAGNYSILDVTITGSFSDGDTVTGADSSATGLIVVGGVVTSGAQDYLVITKTTGTFNTSENLTVSASVEGNTDDTQIIDGASSNLLHAQFKNLAADEYRSDIAAVPGSGNILGVWFFNDIDYAFRNNSGATAAALYKSSSSGWTAVALGLELAFTSGGTTEIVEGEEIVGALSGTKATLTRVMLQTGTWAAGTAAGKFIFASDDGTFEPENINITDGENELATIAGDASAITLLPGGYYEFVNHNFGGGAGVSRMYGCDRVNRGFEFDGTVFAPITTGMTTDTPNHVTAFENHLFFAFVGSSQHSGIGVPFTFTIISGAGELAVGDTITGYKKQPGETGNASLAIFSQNIINVLYGTSSSDWSLVDYREEVGAYAHSIQEFGMTMMLDDRGVDNFLTVQAYGNFQHNVLSRLIQPWVNERKTKINASCIARDKSQYRLFFSDKYALYVTTENRKVIGMMPQLLNDEVKCIYSLEDVAGNEVIKFGSSDGFVYHMEKGTSHDGVAIETIQSFHFHHSKAPRRLKTYKDISFEISGDGYAEFNFSFELGYNSTNIQQGTSVNKVTNFSGSTKWDTAGSVWDTGVWDGFTLTPSIMKLNGSAENISLIILSNSDYFSPIVFSSSLIHYMYRRQLRS